MGLIKNLLQERENFHACNDLVGLIYVITLIYLALDDMLIIFLMNYGVKSFNK